MSGWINRQKKDPYVKKRNKLDLLSRSYFKIEEICNNFSILEKNGIVLDLGCSPGGWCQFLKQKKQYVVGVDLLPIKVIIDEFYQMDICDLVLKDFKPNTILSDIAANFSGEKIIDDDNMCEIVHNIDRLINLFSVFNGNLVVKLFDGKSVNLALSLWKKRFKSYKMFKPKSSRQDSSEIYFIGIKHSILIK